MGNQLPKVYGFKSLCLDLQKTIHCKAYPTNISVSMFSRQQTMSSFRVAAFIIFKRFIVLPPLPPSQIARGLQTCVLPLHTAVVLRRDKIQIETGSYSRCHTGGGGGPIANGHSESPALFVNQTRPRFKLVRQACQNLSPRPLTGT